MKTQSHTFRNRRAGRSHIKGLSRPVRRCVSFFPQCTGGATFLKAIPMLVAPPVVLMMFFDAFSVSLSVRVGARPIVPART